MAPKPTKDGGIKKKKAKAKKDPNAPKKPSGAYIFFCNAMRQKVKEDNPQFTSVAEVGRELGKLWKALSDDDRKKYYVQAEKDKERYKKQSEAYKAGEEAGDEEEEDGDE